MYGILNSTRPTSRSGTICPSSSTARYSLNTQPRPPSQLTSHHDSSRRQPAISTGSPSGMTSTLGNSTSGPVRKLTSAIVKARSACAAAVPKVAQASRTATIRNRITVTPRSINLLNCRGATTVAMKVRRLRFARLRAGAPQPTRRCSPLEFPRTSGWRSCSASNGDAVASANPYGWRRTGGT
jgi:hypothetical protein